MPIEGVKILDKADNARLPQDLLEQHPHNEAKAAAGRQAQENVCDPLQLMEWVCPMALTSHGLESRTELVARQDGKKKEGKQ